jgi:hypothetical protein
LGITLQYLSGRKIFRTNGVEKNEAHILCPLRLHLNLIIFEKTNPTGAIEPEFYSMSTYRESSSSAAAATASRYEPFDPLCSPVG